jgi:DNA-binding response OmpR family regulator
MAKILVAEDDRNQAEAMSDFLQKALHVVETVFDGKEALDRLKIYHYDLAVVDWQMPEMSGIEVIRQFRRDGGKTPILMLTGQTSVSHKVDGLDAGADDYLTKPFDGAELNARVRAMLRRPADATTSSVLSLGNLEFDCNKKKLLIKGEEIVLSPLEMRLMELLVSNANEVVTQQMLLERAWSSESDVSSASVYTCVKAMRKKMKGDEETPIISTVYGMGYRLEMPS